MINRPNARIDDWVWLGLAHVQLWDPSILATRCIIQPHQVHNPHFCGKSLPKRESPIHLWCKFWWNLQNLNESDGFPWVPNASSNPSSKLTKVPSSCASLAAESLQNSGDQWGGGASPSFFFGAGSQPEVSWHVMAPYGSHDYVTLTCQYMVTSSSLNGYIISHIYPHLTAKISQES